MKFLFIVSLFAILASRSLIFEKGYFNMHDDLQMMRQLEMEKCFLDGQIPCRWVPDMGYGFGFPLFNFYPPFPYFIGEVLRLIGANFVTVVKLTFALSVLVSAITMYFLSKEFFGEIGGIISSVFYIWAPYHAVDVYVRGAMNEAWALAWFPLILWSGYKLIMDKQSLLLRSKKRNKNWLILLSVSWFLLLTSHNLMVLIFSPVFAVWCLLFIIKEKKWSKISDLVISGIMAISLSAFFTLPAILEQKFVQVNTLIAGYYEYIAHFANIRQLLFSRFWGYGPSVWMNGDGMSFQVGYVHWVSVLLVILSLFYYYLKNRKITKLELVVILMTLVGVVSLFMTHSRSTPIWQLIPLLKFVQFPWRFLTIVILTFSFVVGYLPSHLNKKLIKPGLILLIFSVVGFSWNYFKPEHGTLGPLTDEEKFSGAAWELQQTAGIYDYLPNLAKEAPKEPRKALAEIIQGSGLVKNELSGTNWASFDTEIQSDGSIVRIGIFKFPNWEIWLDAKRKDYFLDDKEKWGRMYINIPSGNHKVTLKLQDTLIRKIANLLSLASWVGLSIYLIYLKPSKWKKRSTV